MSITVDTVVDINDDIFFSEKDHLLSKEGDLLADMNKLCLDEDSVVEELCEQFQDNMKIRPKFKKVNSENVHIKYVPYQNYLILINDRDSYIKCHFTDMFFILNSYNFVFRKVKSMAYLSNGKIILKLVFAIKNLGDYYEEAKEESSDIEGSDEEALQYKKYYDNYETC